MDDRVVVDLTDLQTVRFTCTSCGAAVTIRTTDFKDLQTQCPGCTRQWTIPGSAEAHAIGLLMRSLHDLAAAAATAMIRVGFDLPSRKS